MDTGAPGVFLYLGDFLLVAGLSSVLSCCLDHSDPVMALGCFSNKQAISL